MFKTKQKSLILDVVNNSCTHPNAYEIYEMCQKHIPNISLGTVYRNLNTLALSKKIKAIHLEDNIIRYDNIKDEHQHFICNKCNKIYDIKQNINLTNNNEIGKVIDYTLIINGICMKCLEKEEV